MAIQDDIALSVMYFFMERSDDSIIDFVCKMIEKPPKDRRPVIYISFHCKFIGASANCLIPVVISNNPIKKLLNVYFRKEIF